MQELEAVRRLVKSPPELWTQCSDAQLLARHLNGFGEITITRLEPESTVAWEGESARGTVTLEASGWGTRVRLTATPPEGGPAVPIQVASQPTRAPRRLATLIAAILNRRRQDVAAVTVRGESGCPGPAVVDPTAVVADLEAALDSLGQAHHRPYSRT